MSSGGRSRLPTTPVTMSSIYVKSRRSRPSSNSVIGSPAAIARAKLKYAHVRPSPRPIHGEKTQPGLRQTKQMRIRRGSSVHPNASLPHTAIRADPPGPSPGTAFPYWPHTPSTSGINHMLQRRQPLCRLQHHQMAHHVGLHTLLKSSHPSSTVNGGLDLTIARRNAARAAASPEMI